jgi:DNA-binding MarR family transcriptional regulator
MKERVGWKIKNISKSIRRNVANSELFRGNPDLTNVIGWTIGFICKRNCEGVETYQKDIEREFKISRSTATELLQNMEQHGYLYREVSSVDNRLKRIVLTDKSIELQKNVFNTLDGVDNKMLNGFTEEEKDVLFSYLARIQKNLDEEDELC